ncbi:hypothetical protein [Rhodococcus sp. IEGM 1374]|uniref:hypothetical protein n=1 Tax=Rhodococcus sp. IEGM 1374 TaxID=3082221 RepID=UPI0029554D69|nr:hypothetical protein [Rhodococcus sp. IEGM 1374]MDV7990494.1 hypothetical protein [Rhodococcus sp. IEGM 1374]
MTTTELHENTRQIIKLVEDAHELADAVDDIMPTNKALAIMLLATLNAYLEHIQFRIETSIGGTK